MALTRPIRVVSPWLAEPQPIPRRPSVRSPLLKRSHDLRLIRRGANRTVCASSLFRHPGMTTRARHMMPARHQAVASPKLRRLELLVAEGDAGGILVGLSHFS